MNPSQFHFVRRVAVVLFVLTGGSLVPCGLTGQTTLAPAQGSAASSAQMPAEAQAQLDKLQDALKATLAGDETTEARELNKIGELYYRTSNYENALEYYNRALIPARSAKDAEQEAAALSGIGSCYRD